MMIFLKTSKQLQQSTKNSRVKSIKAKKGEKKKDKRI